MRRKEVFSVVESYKALSEKLRNLSISVWSLELESTRVEFATTFVNYSNPLPFF